MTQTVTLNKTTLVIDSIIKWDDHAKYDGSVYMTSTKGASYLGFIVKGQNKVAVYKMSNSGGKSFKGYVEIPNCSEKSNSLSMPKTLAYSKSKQMQTAILNKYGVGVEVEEVEKGLMIYTQSVQSTQTLLRVFHRYNVQAKTIDYRKSIMFLPIKEILQLPN